LIINDFFFVLSFKNINLTGFKVLEQGQEVEFTVVQGDKGVEARVDFFKLMISL